ncbi:MAG: peptidoglycan editing factor PgeF [Thermodesulfobacteriota bacterium]|jgi:YfiH family protein|nr:peptidoglycan editing factor PgeF [Candidatus Dadabacteria bacterium]|tara:strand:+ start:33763 stop:34401 length:639 start_codon:yes stop_codon:yes gene_type:complete
MSNYKSIKLSRIKNINYSFGDKKTKTDAFTLNQVHGSDVVILDKVPDNIIISGDSIITNVKNFSIGVKTADCLPILLTNKNSSFVGAVHAGWRGTFYKIICKTINKIEDNFNVKPKDIVAVIGPSIADCCFEVDEDLYKRFIKNFPNFKSCFLQDESKKKIDLKRINYLLLEKMGVSEIEILNECTKCNPNFYSYRRDKSKSQNQISKINLN